MTNDTNKKATLDFINAVSEMAYDQGFSGGFEVGKQVGFVMGVASLKSALSCGLRHGSPECGKALESLKRLNLE
ncbi:hypothetical protein HMPREF1487_09342 [Pseudomonas sp. HPB0071]|uniref:Uncharacterized protein n=1 Tax=Pseudomonas luteola TaxID=47886 RepID=A0ABS0N0F4_PSELU|nr:MULTISPECIES: hypothetical protein [Pseudomonas]ENA27129.1 hypothetical protein HMPREF1487_09342 [Pseudomonas sp. HPB0071]MBA1250080.1 hypothetical protein [Pseudomonas zeshuii]MBH3441709.1 hypothetical protein [Pseudomonas luteola]